MTRTFVRSVQLVLFIATAGAGFLWYSRLLLPYNKAGRWFDERTMVVYDQDAVVAYGALFAVSLVLWSISMVVPRAWRSFR